MGEVFWVGGWVKSSGWVGFLYVGGIFVGRWRRRDITGNFAQYWQHSCVRVQYLEIKKYVVGSLDCVSSDGHKLEMLQQKRMFVAAAIRSSCSSL